MQTAFFCAQGGLNTVVGRRFAIEVVEPRLSLNGRGILPCAYPALGGGGRKAGRKGKGIGLEFFNAHAGAAQHWRSARARIAAGQAHIKLIRTNGCVGGARPVKRIQTIIAHGKGAAHNLRPGGAYKHRLKGQTDGHGLPVKPPHNAAKVQGFAGQVDAALAENRGAEAVCRGVAARNGKVAVIHHAGGIVQ